MSVNSSGGTLYYVLFLPKQLDVTRKGKTKRKKSEWPGGTGPHQLQPRCAAGDLLTSL